MASFTLYYYALKLFFFFGLVNSFVKYDALQKHLIFMAVFYTAGVAALSWVFLLAPLKVVDWEAWKWWLGKTFLLSMFYFWLLRRFDAGFLFWMLLMLGVGVVIY
jgi:hypothetical protein